MYPRYREKQISKQCFSLFVAKRKERKLMNAQKTITMDYEKYREELSNAERTGYARGINANVKESYLYKETLKKATTLETQLGIHKHSLRDEWDKNYILKKKLELAKDQVATYKFLTGLAIVLLLFSEVLKALLF